MLFSAENVDFGHFSVFLGVYAVNLDFSAEKLVSSLFAILVRFPHGFPTEKHLLPMRNRA